MEHIRQLLTIVGGLIIVVGAAWIAHGTHMVSLPGTDFMPKDSVWTVNGSLVAIFGLIVLVGARFLLPRDHEPSA